MRSIGLGLGVTPFGAGGGGSVPTAPTGYVLLTDGDGAYLLDSDGAYLMEAA